MKAPCNIFRCSARAKEPCSVGRDRRQGPGAHLGAADVVLEGPQALDGAGLGRAPLLARELCHTPPPPGDGCGGRGEGGPADALR